MCTIWGRGKLINTTKNGDTDISAKGRKAVLKDGISIHTGFTTYCVAGKFFKKGFVIELCYYEDESDLFIFKFNNKFSFPLKREQFEWL